MELAGEQPVDVVVIQIERVPHLGRAEDRGGLCLVAGHRRGGGSRVERRTLTVDLPEQLAAII